jgi:hypothetical protein
MAAEPAIAVLSMTPDRWRNRAILLYAAMADYSALTKPEVNFLIAVTTFAGFCLSVQLNLIPSSSCCLFKPCQVYCWWQAITKRSIRASSGVLILRCGGHSPLAGFDKPWFTESVAMAKPQKRSRPLFVAIQNSAFKVLKEITEVGAGWLYHLLLSSCLVATRSLSTD